MKLLKTAAMTVGAAVVVGMALGVAPRFGHASPSAPEGQASSKASVSFSEVAVIDGLQSTGWNTILSNTIKTPNNKDLFFDVAFETGLMTRTLASSKRGTKDTSTAEAEVRVRVLVDGQVCYPGEVIFDRRVQTLSATMQGIIERCIDEETGTIHILDECVDPEEVELVLDTMSAHSFSFLAPDCPTGSHTFQVQVQVTNSTSSESGSAEAYGMVGKGIATVQEVRMVQGENIEMP